jgi:hypothetical protein
MHDVGCGYLEMNVHINLHAYMHTYIQTYTPCSVFVLVDLRILCRHRFDSAYVPERFYGYVVGKGERRMYPTIERLPYIVMKRAYVYVCARMCMYAHTFVCMHAVLCMSMLLKNARIWHARAFAGLYAYICVVCIHLSVHLCCVMCIHSAGSNALVSTSVACMLP